jgi:hypothetical protein
MIPQAKYIISLIFTTEQQVKIIAEITPRMDRAKNAP